MLYFKCEKIYTFFSPKIYHKIKSCYYWSNKRWFNQDEHPVKNCTVIILKVPRSFYSRVVTIFSTWDDLVYLHLFPLPTSQGPAQCQFAREGFAATNYHFIVSQNLLVGTHKPFHYLKIICVIFIKLWLLPYICECV